MRCVVHEFYDIDDNDTNEKSVYIACHCFTFILKPLGTTGYIYISIYQKIYQAIRSEYIQTSSKSFHAIFRICSWTTLTHSHVAFISHSTIRGPPNHPTPSTLFRQHHSHIVYTSAVSSQTREVLINTTGRIADMLALCSSGDLFALKNVKRVTLRFITYFILKLL